MQWHYKKLEYDILVPNLDKNVFQLNETEAAAYYEWFIKKIPERVSYVSQICANNLGISKDRMDFSPESLLLLWKWFRKRAKTEAVPRTSEEKQRRKSLDNMWKSDRQLTLETEYILRDIGMYLGEVFRRNNPNLYWTYYTKPSNDFFVNYPLLKGFIDRTFEQPFEACFEPIHMARIQATKILTKKSKDTDLFNLYHIWAEKR